MKILMQVIRKEGGQVEIKMDESMALAECTAAMVAISDVAKARGWHPGMIARSYSDHEMRRAIPGIVKVGG